MGDGDPGRSRRWIGSRRHRLASPGVTGTTAGVGTRHDPALRGIDIKVTHVHGAIASVTVTGPIYVEYIHLVRVDGRWHIVNTLWARASVV